MNKTIDMTGNFQQIFWKNVSKYGIGIAYSRSIKSGFLVAYFKERLPENQTLDTNVKYEKRKWKYTDFQVQFQPEFHVVDDLDVTRRKGKNKGLIKHSNMMGEGF